MVIDVSGKDFLPTTPEFHLHVWKSLSMLMSYYNEDKELL